jgi:hypothetical protein
MGVVQEKRKRKEVEKVEEKASYASCAKIFFGIFERDPQKFGRRCRIHETVVEVATAAFVSSTPVIPSSAWVPE